jgi:hypothetical protein
VSFNLISRGDVQRTPLVDMATDDLLRAVVTGLKSNFVTARAAARRMVVQGSGVILHLARRCAGPGTSPPPPGAQPRSLPAWPDVPTRFLLCRDDRFFPADFLRRVVRDRLAITPDEIDGSHCAALSRPRDLADRLEAFRAEL